MVCITGSLDGMNHGNGKIPAGFAGQYCRIAEFSPQEETCFIFYRVRDLGDY